MNINKSRLKLLQLLKFFGTFLFAYILGCYTIKEELFPYNVYVDWKNPIHKNILSSNELFELVKKGGLVIQFRHTHRDRSAIPLITSSVDRNYLCIDGANLSSLGRSQAKWIKFNMQEHMIPIGEIFSSPACRLKQMTEILFPDKNVTFSDLLFYNRILNETELNEKKVLIKELLSKPIIDSSNRFIMGHQGTYHTPGFALPEGHAFIYKPLGNGSFDFLGTIELSTWLP